MLIHVALKTGTAPELCRKLGDCIHRATDAALNLADESVVQILTEQAFDLTIHPRPPSAERTDATVVILMYPRSVYSDRKKRALFGKIGELLEKEFQIPRRNVVIGMIETPGRNWTFGCDRTELALAMAGQLP
jgi:hypothetical protein